MAMRDEAPTLALLILVYATFVGVTLAAASLPMWVIIPALAATIGLHS